MTGPLSPATGTLLAKGAYDNGFDVERAGSGGWLAFASTRSPLWLWLGGAGDQGLVAAFSRRNVGQALTEHGRPFPCTLPDGALIARVVPDVSALHRMLRRAFQLSLALPDELLVKFQKRTAALPKSTEAERLVVQRVGQDLFRAGLVDYWEGRCAVTGLAVVELLRASHIKPWADCETDAERLDVYNGLLLAPQLDAAFDRGLMTVADDGTVVVSGLLSDGDRHVLGLEVVLQVRRLEAGHRAFLAWHRERVFGPRGGGPA
ncbi:MAG: HNH endonuclease [Holophagales bacterium]|jgi:hypothetical protein|nr:HNH endonuclease [Holophagales bacterium]